MINEEIIRNYLKKFFENREVNDTYAGYSAIRGGITSLLKDNNYSDTFIYNTTISNDRFIYVVLYKSKSVCKIELKRTKTSVERHIYYSSTHYKLKDLEVVLYANTLEERIEQIEKEVIEENKKKEENRSKAIQVYKLIMETYQMDKYEARKLISYMSNNYYAITEDL